MKRHELIRHLQAHGCALKREGARHSLYTNAANGTTQAIPRRIEIDNRLADRVCDGLGIPRPRR